MFGSHPCSPSKAHEGIAGRLPCQIPIHPLQVGGFQGRRLISGLCFGFWVIYEARQKKVEVVGCFLELAYVYIYICCCFLFFLCACVNKICIYVHMICMFVWMYVKYILYIYVFMKIYVYGCYRPFHVLYVHNTHIMYIYICALYINACTYAYRIDAL